MKCFKDIKTYLRWAASYKTFGEAIVNDVTNSFTTSRFNLINKETCLQKLKTPDLLTNLNNYSFHLRNFYLNLDNKVNGLDESDNLILKDLLENLISYFILENKNYIVLDLYEKLYNIFFTNLAWKMQKSQALYETKTSGIYIIYNKQSLRTYVGESNHIEKRFFQHYNKLLEDNHHNKGLQKACHLYGIDSFVFLVAQYGKVFQDLVYRRKQEIQLINNWPGQIYNKKDVSK